MAGNTPNIGTSAASGAGLGASIGSSFGPVGTVVGAAGGALVGGIGAAVAKQRLKKRMQALELTPAEREQLAGAGEQAAAQQAGAAQREVQRQALAEGGSPLSGKAAQLQVGIAQAGAEAGAGARAQADDLARQIEEARRQELLGMRERQVALSAQTDAQTAQLLASMRGDLSRLGIPGFKVGARPDAAAGATNLSYGG